MKTVLEFFGIPETVFEFFRSKSSVSVFLGIGIGHRNFRSESESKSVQLFTDRFLRLPFWSEFTEFTIRNLPKMLTSPAQVSNLQLMGSWPSKQQPTTGAMRLCQPPLSPAPPLLSPSCCTASTHVDFGW
jgi:hypothetical protein